MTDKEKFYKLVLNVLNYEPKETICYDGKLTVFNIYLDGDKNYQIQYVVEKKELFLFLRPFAAYQLTETEQVDLEYFIKALQDKPIGRIILEGIE